MHEPGPVSFAGQWLLSSDGGVAGIPLTDDDIREIEAQLTKEIED